MNYGYNADTDNFGIYSGNNYSAASHPVHGMKWHNFLIYFSLWANALINIAVGGILAMGVFASAGDYRFSMGELAIAALLALCLIALGIYSVVIRFKLKNYRRSAPGHLMAMQILNMLLSVGIYMIEGAALADYIGVIAPSLATIFIHKSYYEKRSDMFVY